MSGFEDDYMEEEEDMEEGEECPECGEIFEDLLHLASHFNERHEDQENKEKDEKDNYNESQSAIEKDFYDHKEEEVDNEYTEQITKNEYFQSNPDNKYNSGHNFQNIDNYCNEDQKFLGNGQNDLAVNEENTKNNQDELYDSLNDSTEDNCDEDESFSDNEDINISDNSNHNSETLNTYENQSIDKMGNLKNAENLSFLDIEENALIENKAFKLYENDKTPTEKQNNTSVRVDVNYLHLSDEVINSFNANTGRKRSLNSSSNISSKKQKMDVLTEGKGRYKTQMDIEENDPVYSNDWKDNCKTKCEICKNLIGLTHLRHHTKQVHGISILNYKATFGSPKIYKRVYHKCGICDVAVILDSDIIYNHIKQHKLTFKFYTERYMVKTKIDNHTETDKTQMHTGTNKTQMHTETDKTQMHTETDNQQVHTDYQKMHINQQQTQTLDHQIYMDKQEMHTDEQQTHINKQQTHTNKPQFYTNKQELCTNQQTHKDNQLLGISALLASEELATPKPVNNARSLLNTSPIKFSYDFDEQTFNASTPIVSPRKGKFKASAVLSSPSPVKPYFPPNIITTPSPSNSEESIKLPMQDSINSSEEETLNESAHYDLATNASNSDDEDEDYSPRTLVVEKCPCQNCRSGYNNNRRPNDECHECLYPTCRRMFMRRNNLYKHLADRNEHPYVCPGNKCKKPFKKSDLLVKHLTKTGHVKKVKAKRQGKAKKIASQN